MQVRVSPGSSFSTSWARSQNQAFRTTLAQVEYWAKIKKALWVLLLSVHLLSNIHVIFRCYQYHCQWVSYLEHTSDQAIGERKKKHKLNKQTNEHFVYIYTSKYESKLVGPCGLPKIRLLKESHWKATLKLMPSEAASPAMGRFWFRSRPYISNPNVQK